FTRVAACTLARSPIRDPLSEGFSHFVTSMTAPVASGWSGCRVGLAPTGERRLVTAHTLSSHLPGTLIRRSKWPAERLETPNLGGASVGKVCYSIGEITQEWRMKMRRASAIALLALPFLLCDHAWADDFYVVGRYYCKHVADNSDAGDCTLTTHSPNSCQEARNVQAQQVASAGDICKHCSGINDDSKYTASGPDWIQGGGPCVGH